MQDPSVYNLVISTLLFAAVLLHTYGYIRNQITQNLHYVILNVEA